MPPLVVHSREVRVAGIERTVPVRFHPGAIRSVAVQASSASDRFRLRRVVAIPIELATPARRPVLCLGCHRAEVFLSLSGVPCLYEHGEDPSDQSDRDAGSRGVE